jgi:CHAT domain-containing protein
MLLGPATSQLAAKRLVIVAPGVLAYLPFASLPVPEDRKVAAGTYVPLVATHEIVNLPSASVLSAVRHETEGRKPASKTIAVLADPVFERSDPRVGRGVARAKAAAETPLAVTAENSALTQAIRNVNPSSTRAGLSRLAFSRQEADAIFAFASPRTGLKATDFNASRATAISQQLADYRILHFATHGLLNNEHPELSGLVFSLVDETGRAEDGFLRRMRS